MDGCRLLAVTSLATCIAAFAAPAHAEKRVALVVGNNDYRNVPKLQKAVNDARTMGDTLKQLGFTVMVAENQNRQAFSQTLLAFDRAVEAGDTAFFFYAGHGFEIAGQNFLLPTDVPAATEGQEELVRDASVSPTASSSGCRTARCAPPFWCSMPAATIRSSAPVRARCRRRRSRADDATAEGCSRSSRRGRGRPRSTALQRRRQSQFGVHPNLRQATDGAGANLVQVAQRTRRLSQRNGRRRSATSDPGLFDQMVDDVFLNECVPRVRRRRR
jgi:hypothetical protein